MQRESSIEKPATLLLKRYGWTVVKVGHTGYPDRIAIHGRRCFWVEFKTMKGCLTKAQIRRIPKLTAANQCVIIIDNVDKLKRDLDYNYYPFNTF